ncbi:hypothetical protein PYJP_18300 [Pyrofollis japonicus]|uniref:prefoldin subunit beta n=1 Tax=Pyrofollis japonicus TaxID=3060460 RepID=UPI00295BC200|nr:prefoldin subunit beta [Pyrofollis japonicus]BEP18478.1 hypothetical protein PYJP_18300 [Pyrofollis japonicus]
MAQRLPPEIENKLTRFQSLQAQYTRLVQERSAVEAEIAEVQRVLKLLEEAGDDAPVYRMQAGILVRVDKSKLVQELKDRLEILEIRLQKLKKQEEEVKKQLDQIAKEIKEFQAKTTLGKQGAGS